jgi:hypothetical protein
MEQEVLTMIKRPISTAKLRTVPPQCSWVDQRLVRAHHIDRLSHPACALSRFLVTVADAQGLRYYADRSLSQRLTMSEARLAQARHELIAQGLVAYQRPLYQGLALGGHHRDDTAPPSPHDDAVDIKAVFERIWEVLS